MRTVQQRPLEEVIIQIIGEKAYQFLKESNGTGLLIIMDGLDEIALDYVRKDPFLTGLIEFTLLVKATILITSRPHACQQLNANRKIEVVGFDKNQIKEFITETLSDDVKSVEIFLQQLHDYPCILDLCYVPMSLVMVTQIFLYRQKSLPSSLTELYKLFVVMILCREKKKNICMKELNSPAILNAAEENLCKILSDLPKEMTSILLILCKLAYHSFFDWCSFREKHHGFLKKSIQKVKEPKLLFNEDDLVESCIVIPKEFDGQGLLQTATIYQLTRDSVIYSFVHLTVQEFLCALYIRVALSQEEQYHILKDSSDTLPNVTTMLCGLTGLKSQEQFKFILSQLSSGSSEYGANNDHVVLAANCLYESQCALSESEKELFPIPLTAILRESFLSLHDLLCVSYTLCQLPIVVLNMWQCHIGDKGVAIISKLVQFKNIELQSLNLTTNFLTGVGIEHLVKIIRSKLN